MNCAPESYLNTTRPRGSAYYLTFGVLKLRKAFFSNVNSLIRELKVRVFDYKVLGRLHYFVCNLFLQLLRFRKDTELFR